jgi:polyisoprenoid-binding protein YceI
MGNTIKWSLDPTHTVVGFKIKHMMISFVRGSFGKYDGTVTTEGDDLMTTKVALTVDASSINTGQTDRDKHLRSSDFFDVDKYKDIVFVSTGVTKSDNEHYVLTGNLTIKDITRPITLQVDAMGPIDDPFGNVRYGFTISGSLSRGDFGLTWNGAMPGGNVMIGDEVFINCEAEIFRKA